MDDTEHDAPLGLFRDKEHLAGHQRGARRARRKRDLRRRGARVPCRGAGAGASVSYSRAKTHYDRPRRYRSPLYTYRKVTSAADELDRLALVDHDRRRPGERGWQSTMRTKPAPVGLVGEALGGNALRPAPPREPIILRDAYKRLLDYRDNRLTGRMRRDVQAQNEAIAGATLGNILPFLLFLRRIFNGDIEQGGRFYTEDGGWQTLSKSDRLRLSIAPPRPAFSASPRPWRASSAPTASALTRSRRA